MKIKMKGKAKGKAIIGIALAAIMLASVFAAIVPLASAQPTGAKREADGSIISGNTLFTGEHGLHFDAAYSDAASLKKVEDGTVVEIITIADPFDFCIPHGVEEGNYEIWNATSKIGYLTIKEPSITGDIFIEGTTDSIVDKSIPVGTKITIHAKPNFGGLMNASDGSGWSKIKIKLIDPDGIEMKDVVDADASEIDITSDEWPWLDTSDWDVGTWKVKIQTDKYTCNEVDVISPYYEFEVRSYELSIDAAEDTVCRGEPIRVKVIGYPRYYYYLIVTHVDVTAPPAIEYAGDVRALDTAGDAYPATGTPNLAAWIKTGSDGIADAKISTTGADERRYTIEVYDATFPVYPDFVPDDDVEWEDDDDVDVEIVKPKVIFDMPSTVIIGEEVKIKGCVSAGDRLDILINDGDAAYFDDEPVDEDSEFEVEWDTEGLTVGTYWIDAYIDCPYYTYTEIETAGIDEDGSTAIWLAAPGLTAEQPRNVIAEDDDYTIEGTATGVDYVDMVLVGPNGYLPSDPGLGVLNGLEIMPSSVADCEFSEDIKMRAGLDLGTWKTMVLAPGIDGTYGDLGVEAGDLEYISTTVFAGKTQAQIVALLEDHTVNVAGSDDLLSSFTFEVETPYIKFDTIESVIIGEPLEIRGTTNREPETTIAIWTIEGPTELPPVITEVEWPTAEQGEFAATIDTSDAVPGTYTLKAEDGDGHSDTATVEIVAGKTSISISTDKYSYHAGDTMYLSLNVANPLDSPRDVGIDIWLEMPAYPWTYILMHKPSVTLPAGLEYTNPSFATFVLPDISSGTYTWHSQLFDPVTGGIISSDTAVWTFSGQRAGRDIVEVLETVTVDVDFG